jgi:hypothetical protein
MLSRLSRFPPPPLPFPIRVPLPYSGRGGRLEAPPPFLNLNVGKCRDGLTVSKLFENSWAGPRSVAGVWEARPPARSAVTAA